MRFIISEPVPVDHRIRTNPMVVVAKVMNFGRRRLAGAFSNGFVETLFGKPQVLAFGLLAGKIEVKEHEQFSKAIAVLARSL